jgi:hypothetical protein
MKRNSVILAMLVFIVPSVALASWWNPFTWFNQSSSVKKETKTEILEKRIIELENKLNVVSATATTSKLDESVAATPTASQTIKKGVKKTNTEKIENIKNYNGATFGVYGRETLKIQNTVEILQLISEDAVTQIDKALQLINQFSTIESLPQNTTETIQTNNAVIEICKYHRNIIIAYKNKIDSYIQSLNNYKTILDQNKKAVLNSFINENQYNTISNYSSQETASLETTLSSLKSEYDRIISDYSADKIKILDSLQNRISNLQQDTINLQKKENNIPSYFPPPINSSHTYCQLYGNNMSCNTYY